MLTRYPKQILERTKSHHNVPRSLPLASTDISFSSSQKSHTGPSAQDLPESVTLQRNDSIGSVNKGSKEKK
jgi:hypothetical protein